MNCIVIDEGFKAMNKPNENVVSNGTALGCADDKADESYRRQIKHMAEELENHYSERQI